MLSDINFWIGVAFAIDAGALFGYWLRVLETAPRRTRRPKGPVDGMAILFARWDVWKREAKRAAHEDPTREIEPED